MLKKIVQYATLDGVLYRYLIDSFDHINLPFSCLSFCIVLSVVECKALTRASSFVSFTNNL